jgi:hypothetical protein
LALTVSSKSYHSSLTTKSIQIHSDNFPLNNFRFPSIIYFSQVFPTASSLRLLPHASASSAVSSVATSSLTSPTFTALRCFASASGARSTDERVIGAVKKYLEERQQDMIVEMKEDGVKDDAKQKLQERIEMMKKEVRG